VNLASWVYFRIEDDGSNLYYSASWDGIFWTLFYSEARNGFMSGGPTKVGLFCDTNNVTYTGTLVSDWFRQT